MIARVPVLKNQPLLGELRHVRCSDCVVVAGVAVAPLLRGNLDLVDPLCVAWPGQIPLSINVHTRTVSGVTVSGVAVAHWQHARCALPRACLSVRVHTMSSTKKIKKLGLSLDVAAAAAAARTATCSSCRPRPSHRIMASNSPATHGRAARLACHCQCQCQSRQPVRRAEVPGPPPLAAGAHFLHFANSRGLAVEFFFSS